MSNQITRVWLILNFFFVITAHASETRVEFKPEKTQALKDYLASKISFKDGNGSIENIDVAEIKEIVEGGGDPLASIVDGLNALHFAAALGDISTLEFLVSCKCNIDVKSKHDAPICYAIHNKKREAILFLLDAGAQIVDCHKKQLLDLMWENGWVELKDSLIARKINIFESAFDPLKNAATNRDTHLLKQLINWGCHLECRSDDGYTPLLSAIAEGNVVATKTLISMGANIHALNLRHENGVILAARWNHTELFLYLVSLGINIQPDLINAARGTIKEMIMSWVHPGKIEFENEIFTLIRIDAHESIDRIFERSNENERRALINLKDTHNQSLLDVALLKRNLKVIAVLLHYGANPLLGSFNGLRYAQGVSEWRNISTLDDQKLYQEIPNFYEQHNLLFWFLADGLPNELKCIIRAIIYQTNLEPDA